MRDNSKELFSILKSEIFTNLLNNDKIKIAELNTAIALLIKCDISFDLEYTSGTERLLPQALLTVFINRKTSLQFTFYFEC